MSWTMTSLPKRCEQSRKSQLTLNTLTWKIWWAPNNASIWQMGFNSAFKGLTKSMEQSPWEADGQYISWFSWKPKFITMFARACHLRLPWAKSMHSTPSHAVFFKSTLLVSVHIWFGLSCMLFAQWITFPLKWNSLCSFLHSSLLGSNVLSTHSKGGFTHSMPCPCCSPAMPCVNSHMPCRSPALLRQYGVLRESPRGSRKYPNC